ncbi:MAG: caspase domain-containing protein, partial [Phenylobacterium sp.]
MTSRREILRGIVAAFGLGLSTNARAANTGATASVTRALVVGNNYAAGERRMRLENAQNDARLVAAKLSSLPNTEADLLLDGTEEQFNQALSGLVSRLTQHDVAIFYYSGHAIQLGGQNYILLGDAETLVNLTGVIQKLRHAAHTTIAFLDACRTNPFVHDGEATDSRALTRVDLEKTRDLVKVADLARSGGVGLARMDLRGTGVLVVFSTDPGNVA